MARVARATSRAVISTRRVARDASRRSSAARRARRGVGTRTAAARSSDAARERELEYLERASTPSDVFTERAFGDAALAESCLRAMRVQWTHGYASAPSGFARCTHGFGEILAGMQPAACDLIMRECFEATETRSVLDPFAGGGTTLVCAQTLGWRAVGADVSPLACFVSANRNWRASEEEVEVMLESARTVTDRAGTREEKDGANDEDASDVPRSWRAVRDALREYLASDAFVGAPRVAEGLWFCMSVALQRTQKSQNKRRHKGKSKGKRGGGGDDASLVNAETFLKTVEEYANRLEQFREECAKHAGAPAPPASIHNVDVRKFKLSAEDKVDAVLTSCPYPAVYDYLSFARKVRAGSGAVVPSSASFAARSGPTSSYVNTVVPGDRNWPAGWTEGEIGSRRALRSDPYAFKDVWQREQEEWLAVVADSLTPRGRAAIMVGDGANIDTRASIVAAAAKFALREVAGCTMKLTTTTEEGRVYNQARTEHLILFDRA
jgi:hypothetical protein